jgi:hypothetical protein
MLKVIPMSKADEHEKACLRCKINYDKNQFAYAVCEDENILGAAQFCIKDGIAYISDLRVAEENMPITMLLGRSVLNFLDLHGIKEAYFEKQGEYYDKAAKIIGFKNKENKWYAYLEGMFTSEHH